LNGNEVVVPASHMALRGFINERQRSNCISMVCTSWRTSWIRLTMQQQLVMLITQLVCLTEIGVRQSLRDTLYSLRINPIANLPGLGLAIFGQKTRSPIRTEQWTV
jgi:hypothetical protein